MRLRTLRGDRTPIALLLGWIVFIAAVATVAYFFPDNQMRP